MLRKESDADVCAPVVASIAPVSSSNRVGVNETLGRQSPYLEDLGGNDLFAYAADCGVDEYSIGIPENPADDNHSAERRHSDAEPLSAKRLGDDLVCTISEDQTVNSPLDYSSLTELAELDLYNKSEY